MAPIMNGPGYREIAGFFLRQSAFSYARAVQPAFAARDQLPPRQSLFHHKLACSTPRVLLFAGEETANYTSPPHFLAVRHLSSPTPPPNRIQERKGKNP